MRRSGPLVVRAVWAVLLVTLLTAAAVAPAGVAGAQQSGELPPPKAQILVDAANGIVLAGNDVHDALRPASTAKIMTALVAVERLPADSVIPVSALAASKPAMRINMQTGQKWPLEQALASLMMVSANDAAYAIGEAAGGGSIDTFAAIANATAKRYGMKDSTLGDPAGLDDDQSYKGGARMSAYDLAIATRNALTVPVIAKYAGLVEYSFTDPTGTRRYLPNHNKMLPGSHAFDYEGLTGFKTGYTELADHSLVATATRNGRTLIAVVLGAPGLGYTEAAHLLDLGFATPANGKGTGERLPDVAVSPYAARVADRMAFAGLGAAPTASASAGGTTVTTSNPVVAEAPLAARPASAQADDTTSGGGGGLLRPRNIVIVLVLVLAALFVLRRRAVKRQRARRIARQRSRAAQMRSGGLPVVDGRYRPGMRLGPPLESHVRIRRSDGPDRRHGTG
jgi:D-alanyl-D-alanine carboxypeptidase (penicillin-binding protein 5/6)